MASKRTMKIAEQLGLSLGGIRKSLEVSADIASQEVVEALDRVLADMEATSQSGALSGYKAVRVEADSPTLKLRKSKIRIPSGNFAWLVTVLASEHHQALGLNVFNILDTGRKKLPRGGPYPLWGLQTGTRIAEGSVRQPSGKFGITQPASGVLSAIRQEPRSVPSREIDLRQQPLRFSLGPIDAVEPLNLYKRAKNIAKSRVTRLAPGVWDVVLVSDLEDVLDG